MPLPKYQRLSLKMNDWQVTAELKFTASEKTSNFVLALGVGIFLFNPRQPYIVSAPAPAELISKNLLGSIRELITYFGCQYLL